MFIREEEDELMSMWLQKHNNSSKSCCLFHVCGCTFPVGFMRKCLLHGVLVAFCITGMSAWDGLIKKNVSRKGVVVMHDCCMQLEIFLMVKTTLM